MTTRRDLLTHTQMILKDAMKEQFFENAVEKYAQEDLTEYLQEEMESAKKPKR